ncbi:MAG: cob(I)yrinic acid a,c-diamide adenosyltransferase [Thermoleophilaceae bacterium]|nr:cob(I)yrinic acid a,c-diamide adenosyltransferase [Thermoleophilaceae bacterium]
MSEVKIYTRKGDDGTTGLWYGGRVKKSDPRTSAYGDVDEAISTIALARAMARESAPEVAIDLLEMQRCLFIGCAQLATADESFGKLVPGVTLVEQPMVDALERRIDHYKDQLNLPPKFIIPGGTMLSAQIDVARTVVRRAERSIVALAEIDPLPDATVLAYVNRCSDLLFALARFTDEATPTVFEGRG